MKTIPFSRENFPLIIQKLQEQEVLILPSDTSYGFSADPFSPKAIGTIQDIKMRPAQKPFLLLISSAAEAKKYGEFSSEMWKFAQDAWEKNTPTTVLTQKKPILHSFFPSFDTVGIRVPVLPILRDFLSQWGKPLISTSANISGMSPLFTVQDTEEIFCKNDITFAHLGDLSVKSPSQIWKEENTKLIRVR